MYSSILLALAVVALTEVSSTYAQNNCTEGAIRLAGRSTSSSGRVEVCVGRIWGTVTDDGWDNRDAVVVCRQLGFNASVATSVRNAGFGRGSGPINLDNVFCRGHEQFLINCSYTLPSPFTDFHFEDAGVTCYNTSGCDHGSIRLVGGTSPMEGRVEVCYQGVWGTVTDDGWNLNDAQVVCRQLNYSSIGATALGLASFGRGTGPIVMTNIACSGNEEFLINCTFSNATHFDSHSEDAGVRCVTSPCSHGDVRLVGGTLEYEGRVEVCLNGIWGTVTDDGWGAVDARVVCRQLGFGITGARAFSFAFFGAGIGPIHLDNVRCFGAEQFLVNCSYTTPRFDNHFEDAGVRCAAPPANCTNGEIRLVNGPSPNQGRVEMCWNRAWGTITDDGWSVVDARVVCRELGYTTIGTVARSNAFYGRGTGTILRDRVSCTGRETRLRDCRFFTPDRFDSHFEDAGVQCSILDNCTHGDIRLLNGTVPSEGRVEVCISGIWGTVSDDLWDFRDARVVCGQLGYSDRFAVAVPNARFTPNRAIPILMDNVFCTGSETHLVNCSYDPNTLEDTHNEDAGVQCFSENATNCNLGDVRLVGGANSSEGRVEVCVNGIWGTICDDFWDNGDAAVICRQLGFSHVGAVAFLRAHFGQGSGPIYLDDMRCTGNEANILDCPHDPNTRDCRHAEDSGVSCRVGGECTHGEVRLVGGAGSFEGRVEVCGAGVWGTVCHDLWDSNDATVVCRQLGLPTNVTIPFRNAFFGQGNVPIAIDDLRCNGSESSLLSCRHDTNTLDCRHTGDAGVACLNASLCQDGDVRLVGGNSSSEGRVEYCQGSVWGTVCDDFWDRNEALVVCRQLGLPTIYVTAHSRAFFGSGRGPIFLDDLRCTGRETRLSSCRADRNTFDCSHLKDAGVTCSAIPECSPEWSIRLLGGSSVAEGRVEVCLNGGWGTVADDLWGTSDGIVVCRQLGFHSNAARTFSNARFGQGTGPIHLDNVLCTGRETRLQDCTHSRDASEDFHSEDAGVRCFQPGECVTGDLRLAGSGNRVTTGRVEVCVGGVWGTVADDFWDVRDARVVCGQLGFSRTFAISHASATFGRGTAPILMDNVNCVGTEPKLINCTFDPDASEDFHFEDAGVTCFNESVNSVCQLGALRLVGGRNNLEGRVEVCLNNRWGTICDDFWNNADANVACRQLGYAGVGSIAFQRARFGQGTGPILLDDLRCVGTEQTLLDCRLDVITTDCSHSEDAGVRCRARVCTEDDVRLVNGQSSNEGRVEVCSNGAWGTVCDDLWGVPDARVVCRQLGYSGAIAFPYLRAFFGRGTGAIALDNVRCAGNESRLIDCALNRNHNCGHSEDAGVRCFNETTPGCAFGDIRLVGGASEREGRVEVCLGGEWGTVCDDSWGTNDATVVCRQLGFETLVAFAYRGAHYGQGSGTILLDDVACRNTENRLIECQADGNTADCRHRDDASVSCLPGNNCTHGEIRLVNGQTESEGRIEVCVNGLWGTVASPGWNTADARVVCRQLNYTNAVAIAVRGAGTFGRGSGLIHYSLVQCTGDENILLNCPRSNDASGNNHRNDAGVRCLLQIPGGCSVGSVRLAGGSDSTRGRVEVCLNGTDWGTVTDDFWNDNDARVVCRQLGFSTAGSIARIRAFYGRGNGPIVLDNLFCNGREASLFHCPFVTNPRFKSHAEDAGVRCFRKVSCDEGSIRLVGGASDLEGRLEVCLDQAWGTVTDFFFNLPDARVACRQLGYNDTTAVIRRNAFYGQGEGLPIAMDTLFCRGTEERIVNCTFNPNTDNHSHRDDVGVSCLPGPAVSTTVLPSSTPVPSSTPSVVSSTPVATQPPSVVVVPPSSTPQQPPVQSSTPAVSQPPSSPTLAVNPTTAQQQSVVTTLAGLTAQTFTAERRDTFQEVTAEVINDFCRRNPESCTFVSKKRDINTRAVLFEKSDIEFNGIRNTDEGNLEVTFFAKKGSTVLKGDILAGAVTAGSDMYARRGFSMIAVSQPLGNQAPGFSSTALAIIVVVVIAIIVIAIVVVVIAIFWMRKRSAKDDSLAIGLVNSQSMTSGIAEDNPVFINTSATDESKLRFEHLEEDMEEEEEDIEKDTAEL